MSEYENFLQRLKADYTRVFRLFCWIVGISSVFILGMGSKMIASDSVQKQQIRDLQSIVVPNYDIVTIMYLWELKTDAIVGITEGKREEVKETIDKIDDKIGEVIARNQIRIGAARGVTTQGD